MSGVFLAKVSNLLTSDMRFFAVLLLLGMSGCDGLWTVRSHMLCSYGCVRFLHRNKNIFLWFLCLLVTAVSGISGNIIIVAKLSIRMLCVPLVQ